jgi:hypothetical protein
MLRLGCRQSCQNFSVLIQEFKGRTSDLEIGGCIQGINEGFARLGWLTASCGGSALPQIQRMGKVSRFTAFFSGLALLRNGSDSHDGDAQTIAVRLVRRG